MSIFIKNERTGKFDEYPPYKCKLCGLSEIENDHDICLFCGWEDDDVQNDDKSLEISEKTFVGISFHDENENLCQLKISDGDMISLKNILLNCYGYQYDLIGFDWVCVNEHGVFFNYGEKGCGIVRTNNIHKFMQWFGNGFNHLSDDWYGIY